MKNFQKEKEMREFIGNCENILQIFSSHSTILSS